jgi:hypothetical protein
MGETIASLVIRHSTPRMTITSLAMCHSARGDDRQPRDRVAHEADHPSRGATRQARRGSPAARPTSDPGAAPAPARALADCGALASLSSSCNRVDPEDRDIAVRARMFSAGRLRSDTRKSTR